METNPCSPATSSVSGAWNADALAAMDRIAPSRRPERRVVGYQTWRQLLFVHWAVDAELLQRQLPAGLQVDLLHGVAYVGIVPFWMEGIRPRWWPDRLAFSFWETNLRTYVLHGNQPGVYFFSLDATSPLAVRAARLSWSLPYFDAEITSSRQRDVVDYSLRRRRATARLDVRYRIGAALGPSLPGSVEHFLLERYLLFVQRGRHLLRGQVHHTPYPAHGAEVQQCKQTLFEAMNLPATSAPPCFAHFSPGVQVEIFGLQRTVARSVS